MRFSAEIPAFHPSPFHFDFFITVHYTKLSFFFSPGLRVSLYRYMNWYIFPSSPTSLAKNSDNVHCLRGRALLDLVVVTRERGPLGFSSSEESERNPNASYRDSVAVCHRHSTIRLQDQASLSLSI